jgi:hypothetical protein
MYFFYYLNIACTCSCKELSLQKSSYPINFHQERNAANQKIGVLFARFKVYVRLAMVLTAPWCCGVAAAVGGFPFLWYAAAMLIGLQGAFLFVAFGAKRRLTQMAWKKATGKPLRRRTTREQRAALDKQQAAKSISASAASINDAEKQHKPSLHPPDADEQV